MPPQQRRPEPSAASSAEGGRRRRPRPREEEEGNEPEPSRPPPASGSRQQRQEGGGGGHATCGIRTAFAARRRRRRWPLRGIGGGGRLLLLLVASALLPLLTLCLNSPSVSAFSFLRPSPGARRVRRTAKTFGGPGPRGATTALVLRASRRHEPEEEDDDGDDTAPFDGPPRAFDDNDGDDVEQARRALEQLFTGDSDNDLSGSASGLASAAQLYRSQLEISLLESLLDSDDAIDELVHMWVHSTTVHNAQVLERMSVECSPGMHAEQEWLRAALQQHPNWVEPRVRLATLLFYKGETRQSYQQALEAFQHMPYHFEVVPLLIMISLREGDMAAAVRWARQGLPTLRGTSASTRRRAQWVRNATEFVRQRQRHVERQLMKQQQKQQQQDEARKKTKKKKEKQRTKPSVTDTPASWQ